MDDFGFYEWIIYCLSLFSIMMLGFFIYTKVKDKYRVGFSIFKSVVLAIFIITSMYWIITFPYVGWTYNFSSNKNTYSKELDSKSIKSDIEQNTRRIAILERELEDTQKDLEAITNRIKLILQLVMYGLIYFGIGWAVKSFQKDKS